jgi:aspartate carbamoyltransferase catalytic subunit
MKGVKIMLKGRHLLDPMDFTVEEIEEITDYAQKIIDEPEKYSHLCDGRLLATLFYEPSTRTRFSFEAAMLRLGGRVIGFSEPNSSSVAKGESIGDTIRTIACYADIAVMRHPKEGAPRVASQYADIPVINAGDGGHMHPTQTLTDILTIKSIKGNLSNLTLGFCGDLKFGRTVHSLIKAMSRYENNKFVLVSPGELKVPDYITQEVLKKNNIEFQQVEKLDDVIGELDILYMTRVQKERFFNEEDYIRLKDSYILDEEKLKKAKEDMIVLHPLPRVNEIAYEVDSDPRACYFRQAKYGMYVRMALIAKLLGVDKEC